MVQNRIDGLNIKLRGNPSSLIILPKDLLIKIYGKEVIISPMSSTNFNSSLFYNNFITNYHGGKLVVTDLSSNVSSDEIETAAVEINNAVRRNYPIICAERNAALKRIQTSYSQCDGIDFLDPRFKLLGRGVNHFNNCDELAKNLWRPR